MRFGIWEVSAIIRADISPPRDFLVRFLALAMAERRMYSVGRCPDSVTDYAATTYESAEPSLTELLTYSSGKLAESDPELAAVMRSWPELPEPIRAGIGAMVQAASKGFAE